MYSKENKEKKTLTTAGAEPDQVQGNTSNMRAFYRLNSPNHDINCIPKTGPNSNFVIFWPTRISK